MTKFHNQTLPLLFSAMTFTFVFILSGCGPEMPYKVVPLKGTIMHQGKPLCAFDINFSPEEGRPSHALVQEDGTFEARYTPDKDGVQAGKLHVSLTPANFDIDGHPILTEQDKLIYKKYNPDAVPFYIEITKPEKNYTLELP